MRLSFTWRIKQYLFGLEARLSYVCSLYRCELVLMLRVCYVLVACSVSYVLRYSKLCVWQTYKKQINTVRISR